MGKYLNDTGLGTFISLIKNAFATKTDVDNYIDETKEYVTEVDYTQLEFDTKECFNDYIEELNTDIDYESTFGFDKTESFRNYVTIE